MSKIEVAESGPQAIHEMMRIPMYYTVESEFRVEVDGNGMGGLGLIEQRVAEPYVKDYDQVQGGREHILSWPREFDITPWGFFLARRDGKLLGSTVIVRRTPAVRLLEGRDDLAVLWDLRVRPDHRRQGVGTALFRAAADWSRERGCRHLKVETSNTNVPACRFYAAQGCVLGGVNRFAYLGQPEVAREAELLWYLEL